jgi:hypothetical protein
LHWSLDVAFREDSCWIRADHAGKNMAIIRKASFNLLKLATTKLPLKRRRTKALLEEDYRTQLIMR